MKPLESSTGERSTRGRRKGDNPAQEGPGARKPYTPMLPGSGSRPRYTPRREPKTPRGYGRREDYEGERGPRGRGGERILTFQKEKLKEVAMKLTNPFWKDVLSRYHFAKPYTEDEPS